MRRSLLSKVRHSPRVCDRPYNVIPDPYNLSIDGDSETRTTSRRGSATFGDASGEVPYDSIDLVYDDELYNIASTGGDDFSTPQFRVESITLNGSDPRARQQILAREVGDTIRA